MTFFVDIQMVFSRVGLDVMLFVAAVLVYLALQHVKGKAQKTPDKDIPLHVDEVDIKAKVTGIVESKLPMPSEELPEKKMFEATTPLALMQKHATARNIKDTLGTFRLVEQSGDFLTSAMYNTVLLAWVRCGNIFAAEAWMDDIRDAGMADENSFAILIKALVITRDLDKARALLDDMEETGLLPSSSVFDELLIGLARGGQLHEGISMLKEMDATGIEPSSVTFDIAAKLVNSVRGLNLSSESQRHILRKYGVQGQGSSYTQPPRLAALLSQAKMSESSEHIHDVEVTGTLSQIKALRRTLKQHGFLDKAESDAWPLDGHWETEHGLTVVVERKIVRWSEKCASRLHFTSEGRSSCTLLLYGELTRGHFVQPAAPGAPKVLQWDNGDVWHSYSGRIISQTMMQAQTMTRSLRDTVQDHAYRARTTAVLKCVSRQGLGMPSTLESSILQYLGNNLHYIRVNFESKATSKEIFNVISCRYPRVGFRHCWVNERNYAYGQRTIVNGEETDEACFSKHIGAVCIA